MSSSTGEPTVSFVVPARNEADPLPATLSSLDAAAASVAHEVLVVDGDSDDTTRAIARDHGARVLRARPTGQGDARHRGARRAAGRRMTADGILRTPGHYTRLEYRRLSTSRG